MKAYKIWNDEKNFIHKDTTNEMDICWTENINDAKDVANYSEAAKFFFGKLGFSLNLSKYNALYLL